MNLLEGNKLSLYYYERNASYYYTYCGELTAVSYSVDLLGLLSMEYTPTIGLEIHAELKTKTKMFCDSPNKTLGERPNTNICPVCMGHPGTLPVINKEAVRHVLRVGTALQGELADFTEFDRKNYFYPDIPKGYQISQYQYPLVRGGVLCGIAITRIHLEEDTARSVHHTEHSLVDYNRAGVPLMELVTEPVVKNAQEAGVFARELQLLLRTLGVSDANMERGEMRVEANVSISKTNTAGVKVEVKNLNSFKAVEKAIAYEMERQKEVLEKGGVVVQETRGWDEKSEKTFLQRIKESSEDYRYFPDPDLPKLKISEIEEFNEKEFKESLPELPWVKRERLMNEFGVQESTANFFIHTSFLVSFADEVINQLKGNKEGSLLALNYISSDLVNVLGEDVEKVKFLLPQNFVTLILMIQGGELSSRGAKDILAIMVEKGGSPKEIAKKEGLTQKSDEGELKNIVEKIIDENKEVVSQYKEGKENALQFLIGQAMKETKGSANPEILKKLFIESLNK
ncbi:MAG: Asp-tRNA(Asn)/Glu-tRNA(Gln) amidotransferase subunit GatB [Candidatus Paceibacterota bacterium]